MPAFGLMTTPYRAIGLFLFLAMLAGGSAALAWHFQDWRYGRQLSEQARLHAEALNQLTLAAAMQQQAEHDKRLALEQRLSASEHIHYRALSDAQRDQGRLRDRLATADLRLSVLLDAGDAAPGNSVPASASSRSLDNGASRARLDPAHAQRIIAITDAGDSGLIALQACQDYVRAVAR
ncbi:lysis protein [Pseudomonas sp.]|uniref:lysis protein n=1 Tax=Pseudomonas sp. TaxID=306 RepID=UPI003F3E4A55